MSFSIAILSICRKGDPLDEEIERYQKLIRPWASVSVLYLKSPGGSSYGKNELLEAEAKILTASIPKKSFCVALSEEGKCPASSRAFAQWLAAQEQRSHAVTFIIGGAYGLSPLLKKTCAEALSLSPLTFPHKLSLVVVLEQIYRAFTILKGHPYHK
jgi:23S rRNA (pseudouridine1915-N3)-methyltransferase